MPKNVFYRHGLRHVAEEKKTVLLLRICSSESYLSVKKGLILFHRIVFAYGALQRILVSDFAFPASLSRPPLLLTAKMEKLSKRS